MMGLRALVVISMVASGATPRLTSEFCECKTNPLWEYVESTKGVTINEGTLEQGKPLPRSKLANAAVFGYDGLVKEMVRQPEIAAQFGPEALYWAAAMGRLNISSILINGGVSVNSRAPNGFTPVFAAVQNNCAKELLLLLSRGADANMRQPTAYTVLEYAILTGHFDVAEILLSHGYKASAGEKDKLHTILKKRNDEKSYERLFPRGS